MLIVSKHVISLQTAEHVYCYSLAREGVGILKVVLAFKAISSVRVVCKCGMVLASYAYELDLVATCLFFVSCNYYCFI